MECGERMSDASPGADWGTGETGHGIIPVLHSTIKSMKWLVCMNGLVSCMAFENKVISEMQGIQAKHNFPWGNLRMAAHSTLLAPKNQVGFQNQSQTSH